MLKTAILKTITGWNSFTFWLSGVKYWKGTLFSPIFTLQHWFTIMKSWVWTTNCWINFQFFQIDIRLVWRYWSLGYPLFAFLAHHNTDLCPCLYFSAQIFKLRRIPSERQIVYVDLIFQLLTVGDVFFGNFKGFPLRSLLNNCWSFLVGLCQ